MWIVCEEIVGHGFINTNGGNGNGQGGAGSGGRISIQSSNTNKLQFYLVMDLIKLFWYLNHVELILGADADLQRIK